MQDTTIWWRNKHYVYITSEFRCYLSFLTDCDSHPERPALTWVDSAWLGGEKLSGLHLTQQYQPFSMTAVSVLAQNVFFNQLCLIWHSMQVCRNDDRQKDRIWEVEANRTIYKKTETCKALIVRWIYTV